MKQLLCCDVVLCCAVLCGDVLYVCCTVRFFAPSLCAARARSGACVRVFVRAYVCLCDESHLMFH